MRTPTRTALAAALLAGLVMVGVCFTAAPAHGEAVGTPAVFLSPHQDDETLSMGASILQHVRAGRPTFVVLLTDGGASAVGARYATRAALVAERDREFTAAVHALGATPIIRDDRAPDGQLTAGYVRSVITEYAARWPGASFKTMSDNDPSHDHHAAGAGLRWAVRDGITDDARFYVRRRNRATDPCLGGQTRPEHILPALLAYAPVGWYSVTGDFAAEAVRSDDWVCQ